MAHADQLITFLLTAWVIGLAVGLAVTVGHGK